MPPAVRCRVGHPGFVRDICIAVRLGAPTDRPWQGALGGGLSVVRPSVVVMKEVDHMHPTTPPTPRGSSVAVIDCETCPVRGRHCGDCFVPVLGRIWLETPTRASAPATPSAEAELPERTGAERADPRHGAPVGPESEEYAGLDSDELAAVSAFVRAGLVAPREAQAARAHVEPTRRVAAG